MAGVAVLGLAACGGGGSAGSTPPAPVVVAGHNPGVATAAVALTISWPKPLGSSSGRHRSYLSNSTKSVTISVNGGTPVSTNDPNLSPGTGMAFTQSTTVMLNAPTQLDTFVVSAYDANNGGGSLLGSVTLSQTIVADTANTIVATLNGNLAKIAISPVSSPFLSGSAGAYTVVGQSPQTFNLTPEDADGNAIILPGAIPPLTLTSATAASVSATVTSTTNQYAVQAHVPSTTVTLTAAGKNLAGTAVSATCTVTTVAAIYVANYSPAGTTPSVTIYPATASGNATPIATLAGTKTLETAIQFPAVDQNGVLYLSNQGPLPGALYGPTSGFISIFNGSAQNGNVAPTGVIANLNRPEGLSVDGSGDLWAMLERSIVEYPASPTASSAQIASIGVPNPTTASPAPVNATGLDGCYGLYVGPSTGTIYAACSDVYNVFAKGTTGNTAPEFQVEPPGSTTMTFASDSWLSVVADSTGNIYLPGFNNNVNNVSEYSATANDGSTTPTPSFIAEGTGFDLPFGIAIDTAGAFYISNYGNNSVTIYSSSTALETGVATTTISGAATGLNGPYGIAVR